MKPVSINHTLNVVELRLDVFMSEHALFLLKLLDVDVSQKLAWDSIFLVQTFEGFCLSPLTFIFILKDLVDP